MRSLIVACGTLMFSHTAIADPQPTATEIFHLKTECGKLGKALLEEIVKNRELLKEKENTVGEVSSLATTNYNQTANRCYVKVTHTQHTPPLRRSSFDGFDDEQEQVDYLVDRQTKFPFYRVVEW
jgi:hypothetical protein